MLIAVRKNRQLRIPNEKRKVYESLGYTIKDTKGKVLSEPEDPKKEVEELKAKLAEAEQYAEKDDKRIEELEAEVAALKAEAAEPAAEAEPKKAAASTARKKTTA